MIKEGLCYFRLSGSHPTLPIGELRALLEIYAPNSSIVSIYGLVSVVECGEGERKCQDLVSRVIGRAGLAKEGGLLLSIADSVDALLEDIRDVIGFLRERVAGTYRVEAHRLMGLWKDVDPEALARKVASLLNSAGLPTSPKGDLVITIFYAEGTIIAGLRVAQTDAKSFARRSPGKRPFFKPGPLDPRLSRALVNLSRVREGSVFWDPFCGTGGLVIEACLVGASKCLCGDIDHVMVSGSEVNLGYYGLSHYALSYLGDAATSPIATGLVDAVATDPPYGRSTTLGGRSRRKLYELFLCQASDALRPGSYLVFASPADERVHTLAEELGFEIVERYYMYVHGSLVREIVVAMRP